MLTTKGWKLYNLLKSDPNKWWSCEEIHKFIPELELVNDARNPSPEITALRLVINESPEVDKIIVTKKHCFKIATLEEYKNERASQIKKLKNLVAQIQAKDRKYERDNQCKLFSNVLTELTDKHEQYHETFIRQTHYLVNLAEKKVYIVECKDIKEIGVNLMKVVFENGEEKSIYPIHEIITKEKLNTPFYENYDRIVLCH